MKNNNVLLDKSFEFATKIVKLSQFLVKEKQEYVLSRQVLKSGTFKNSILNIKNNSSKEIITEIQNC